MKIKKKAAKKIAKQLESFVELIDGYFRLENLTKEEYEESINQINKAIKKLKKGETKGIIDKKTFRIIMFKDKAFREEYQDGVELTEEDEDEFMIDSMDED